jgi:hypothetical protein
MRRSSHQLILNNVLFCSFDTNNPNGEAKEAEKTIAHYCWLSATYTLPGDVAK